MLWFFSVVMYGYESWIIEKAECQRIYAFKLWCWRRLLRVPWTARRSNQSILKEISPEYSLEGLMLKLKLQYFGHLMQRTDSLVKDLDAGKDWGQEEKGMTENEMIGWHHQLYGHEFQELWWTEKPGPWGCKELDTTEQLNLTDQMCLLQVFVSQYVTCLISLLTLIFFRAEGFNYNKAQLINYFFHGLFICCCI